MTKKNLSSFTNFNILKLVSIFYLVSTKDYFEDGFWKVSPNT